MRDWHNTELPRTIAIEDVAARLGVSPWTIRTWIRKGMLSYHKIGRRVLLNENELRQLLAHTHVPARPSGNGKGKGKKPGGGAVRRQGETSP